MHDSITITMKTNKISLYKWLTPVWITLIMVGIFLSYLTYIIVVEFNEFELIDILLWLFALILWGCLLSTWIIFWKWCSYITFGQDEIVSFHIPGKLLCKVELSKSIYSSVFMANLSRGDPTLFIALSNDSFVNLQNTTNNSSSFIIHYDKEKILIFPFTKKTAQMINYNNWIAVDEQTERYIASIL